MGDINRDLIVRFFKQECSDEEAKKVSDFLNTHQDALNTYLNWSEWHSANKEYSFSSDEETTHVWELIKANILRKRRKVWVSYAAAIAIFLIGTMWLWSMIKRNQLQPRFETVIANNTQQIKWIQLSDSSTVLLYPGSILKLDTGYNHNRRQLELCGKASFKVAKQKQKPFIVKTGVVSTTALGTKFVVDEITDPQIIKVELLEGHVKVEVPDNKNINTVLLLPGNKIEFSKAQNRFLISKKQPAKKIVHKDKIKQALPSAKEKIQGPVWYRFNNQRLEEVLKRLETLYNAKIRLISKPADAIYFIGQFKKTDKLEDILATIAQLNNLKIEKIDESSYVLTNSP